MFACFKFDWCRDTTSVAKLGQLDICPVVQLVAQETKEFYYLWTGVKTYENNTTIGDILPNEKWCGVVETQLLFLSSKCWYLTDIRLAFSFASLIL